MHWLRKKTPGNTRRRVERHLNLPLLPVVAVTLAIIYGLTGYRGWLIFAIGTAGAWVIALVWLYSMQRTISIERNIHLAWATVGESVPEQIRLNNRGWLPASWVEITDESASIETPLRIVSDVAPHSYRSRHLSHLFKRRGIYTLGPTLLRCGDPLGVYTLTMTDQQSSTILVTPPVLSLAGLKIPSGGIAGDERRNRGYIERNISEAGLRDYTAGDSLKRIHWPATAHFDRLIVKHQESATARDWWIFLDLDSAVQAGAGDDTTLELSVILAASLAIRGLREYRKVGLVMAGPQFIDLEPGEDPSQRWRILRALAIAQAGERPFEELLIQGRFSQAGTAIMITPSTNRKWVATASRYRKTGSMIALLVDPGDFGSPLDQGHVVSALATSRIPYTHIPGSLLAEAYSASSQSNRRQILASQAWKRPVQQGRYSWQRMD